MVHSRTTSVTLQTTNRPRTRCCGGLRYCVWFKVGSLRRLQFCIIARAIMRAHVVLDGCCVGERVLLRLGRLLENEQDKSDTVASVS